MSTIFGCGYAALGAMQANPVVYSGSINSIARRPQPGGFALLDPLVGILVFAFVMVGAINLWRLAEYKCTRARIDARVSQILRESTDYVNYVAYDLLPADGAQLRSGFLLHPIDPSTGNYNNIYSFNVTAAVTTTGGGTPAEAKQIVLTLSYNTASEPQAAADNPLQTVRTDVLNRVKD